MTTNHPDARALSWNLGHSGERASREPFAWLSRLGISLLSYFSQRTDDADGGSAGKETHREQSLAEAGAPLAPFCCHLANWPGKQCPDTGNPYDYTCGAGFQKMWWYCVEGTTTYGCGECVPTTTKTCWGPGPFDCSKWWKVGTCR
jgi:hypothetical protein